MLFKCCAKFTLSTCSGPAATAHEFLQPTPTALRSVVVVGTTDSSVSLGPVTAITRPVLLVPVRRSVLRAALRVYGATPQAFAATRWTERDSRSE